MNVDRNNPDRNLAMQVYSDEELISYLQEFYYMEGRVPTQRDLTVNNFKNYPNYGSYCLRFGSFKDALIISDLYKFVEHKHLYERINYTKESIIYEFEKFIKENNRFPNSKDIKDTKNNNLPSQSTISNHFESIHEIRNLLGYSKASLKEMEKKEALQSLLDLYYIKGTLTARMIETSIVTKCGKYYRDNFGSIKEACNLVGLDYPFRNNKKAKESK